MHKFDRLANINYFAATTKALMYIKNDKAYFVSVGSAHPSPTSFLMHSGWSIERQKRRTSDSQYIDQALDFPSVILDSLP